jgi:8-oxo-dGTP pyrophosphatase MutT (NUDIX family)
MSHEVVAALIVQADRILLGLRSPGRALYPSVWDMFGGHVEPGEGPLQTLVRELQEELGITPTAWTFLETLTLSLPSLVAEEPDEMIVHLYRVTEWTGSLLNRQPEEHSTIGWFSLKGAAALPLADPMYPTLFARYGTPLNPPEEIE